MVGQNVTDFFPVVLFLFISTSTIHRKTPHILKHTLGYEVIIRIEVYKKKHLKQKFEA